MKKAILFICFCKTTLCVQAQITLHSGNVAQSPTYNANLRFQPGATSAAVPEHGANRSYDYSGLKANFSRLETYRPATRSGFTSYSRYLSSSTFIGDIPLPSEYYYHLTGDGLFETGAYQSAQTLGIANFGGPSDSIVFPGANVVFTAPAAILKFPCTYGQSWTANHVYNTPFKLTVASFTLSNAPALWVQWVYKTDSVVGWGQLTLPSTSGPSNPVDVLLIKTSRYTVDSYYINGSPAPAALLSGLNVRQNDSNYSNTYTFHAAGAELPLFSIYLTKKWEVVGGAYYTNGIYPLAADNPGTLSGQVYPNPVQAGQLLRFDLNGLSAQLRISILDMQGRQVHSWAGEAEAAHKGIRLPAILKPGQYVYRVESEGGVYLNGKINVD
jgi:hypothetical protein